MMRAALEALADQLRAAGIRATLDHREINTPCVYIRPRTLAHDILGCLGTLTVDCYIVTRDAGGQPAIYSSLDELLAQVLDVIEPTADTDLFIGLATPQSPTPLPAYRVTTELHP